MVGRHHRNAMDVILTNEPTMSRDATVPCQHPHRQVTEGEDDLGLHTVDGRIQEVLASLDSGLLVGHPHESVLRRSTVDDVFYSALVTVNPCTLQENVQLPSRDSCEEFSLPRFGFTEGFPDNEHPIGAIPILPPEALSLCL